MRNICIIGLGSFGFHCARSLEGKAEVTAVDIDREKIQRVGPHVARAIVADARQAEVLHEIGVESAEVAVVSVGSPMETSILITLHLKSLGVEKVFAKSLSDEHSEILRLVGATRVLQPEREVAENLARTIAKPSIVDFLQLHRNFGIIEIDPPPQLVDRRIQDVRLRSDFGLNIIAVFRGGGRLINPDPSTIIRQTDRLVILGAEQNISSFEEKLR